MEARLLARDLCRCAAWLYYACSLWCVKEEAALMLSTFGRERRKGDVDFHSDLNLLQGHKHVTS